MDEEILNEEVVVEEMQEEIIEQTFVSDVEQPVIEVPISEPLAEEEPILDIQVDEIELPTIKPLIEEFIIVNEDDVIKDAKMLTKIRQEFGLNEAQMSILVETEYNHYLSLESTPVIEHAIDYNEMLDRLETVKQEEIDIVMNPTIETIRTNNGFFGRKNDRRNNLDKIKGAIGLNLLTSD